MFVRSLMDKDVIYRKGGLSWTIKANTVTFIDEVRVSAKELKGLYGSRIIIISKDAVEDEIAEPIIKRQKEELEKKPSSTLLDEKLIDDIIAQIEAEESSGTGDKGDEDKPADDSKEELEELENKLVENVIAQIDAESNSGNDLKKDTEEEKAKLKELEDKLKAEKEAQDKKVKTTTARSRVKKEGDNVRKSTRRGRKSSKK